MALISDALFGVAESRVRGVRSIVQPSHASTHVCRAVATDNPAPSSAQRSTSISHSELDGTP